LVTMAREPLGAATRSDPTTRDRKFAPIGLGLAALGRPGYITVGHARDLAGAAGGAAPAAGGPAGLEGAGGARGRGGEWRPCGVGGRDSVVRCRAVVR